MGEVHPGPRYAYRLSIEGRSELTSNNAYLARLSTGGALFTILRGLLTLHVFDVEKDMSLGSCSSCLLQPITRKPFAALSKAGYAPIGVQLVTSISELSSGKA